MAMEEIGGVRNLRFPAALDLSQYSQQWDLRLFGAATLVVLAVGYGAWRQMGAKLPPGPRNWPFIGALLEMKQHHEQPVLKTLEKFVTEYGPIVHFRLGLQSLVVLSSAEAAEDLLKHRDAEFSDRATAMTRSVAKYTGFNGAVFQFANYTAEYKMLKEISVTEFFTPDKMKSYEKLRTREVAAMVEKVFGAIPSSDVGKEASHNTRNGRARATPMGIQDIAVGAIRNIIFSLCTGTRFDSLPPTNELTELPIVLDNFMEFSMNFNLVDYFPWFSWVPFLDPDGLVEKRKMFKKRQTRFYEMILWRHRQAKKQKRESGNSEDAVDDGSSRNFLDVLLHAQEEGTKLKDNSIMATLSSILSAGIESTSFQVEWVLLELARHPRMLQRLQYELDAFVGKDRPLEEADLQFMQFLNAVVLETLRLHPVAPYLFPHVNKKSSTICGYRIPAKTAVIVNCYRIGRDPKRWKNPLQFNPDRFTASGSSLSPDSIKANGNFYNLLPFGSGMRACPGHDLAMVLLLRTVGSLVHAFDWTSPRGRSAKDLTVEEVGDFLLHPSPSLYLVPTPRLSPKVYKSNIT